MSVVTIAFALRREFQSQRVPGYITAQTVGAVLACWLLQATFGAVGKIGATLPQPGFTSSQAFNTETVLTLGLVSTILGTASSAQSARCCRVWPPLLALVSQYLRVGMLVGASIGTAGMAVLFWFRLRAAGRTTTDP